MTPVLFILLMWVIITVTDLPSIYPVSLHDALPILVPGALDEDEVERHASALDFVHGDAERLGQLARDGSLQLLGDRKSTRLNSSHLVISYAVFCLKIKIEIARI